MRILRRGDRGEDVARLEQQLTVRGYPVEVDGIYGLKTYEAVRAFQSQHIDANGMPLRIDGIAGPLTCWSLTHRKPRIDTQSGVDFHVLPSIRLGGSVAGRGALEVAIRELTAGAGEIGGNNRGPWVRKYLNGIASQGSPWCAGFVSWCYAQIPGGSPFPYTLGARAMLQEFRRRSWAHAPGSGYLPQPGDVVFWWRVRFDGWQGHVGLVYELRDGILYTIEGNKSPRVQGFSYVHGRMEKLLGFGHIPDAA